MARKTTAKFGADNSDFKKGVSQMSKALDDLNKKIIENQAAQKEANSTINAAQKEIKSIEKDIKDSGEATEDQKKRIDELNKVIDEERSKLAHLKTEQSALRTEMKNVSKETENTKKKTDELKKANDDLKKSLSDVKTAGADAAKDIAAIGAVAVGSVAGMFEFIHAAAQWADSVNTMNQVTGISTAELQKFMYASQLIDVDLSTITGSLTKLTKAMNSAKDGSGDAAEAFKTLKVAVTDEGELRDRQDVFYEIIEALAKIENETERDALAMTVFGKSAEQINPLIKGGADALKQLGDQAEKSGLILDQETLNSLHAFNDEIDTLKAQGSQISKIVASQAKPAVEDIVKIGNDALKIVKDMADSGELADFFDDAGKAIRAGVDQLRNLLDFVNKNKEAIVGITAAVVAFKVAFSVGSLISSLVAAFGALRSALDVATLSQLELNAAMSANPIGIVLGLLSALTVGLIAYNAAANTAKKGTDAFTAAAKRAYKAVEDFDRATQTAKDNYAETISNAEAEAALIDKLKDSYDRLKNETHLTAGEQAEFNIIAEELAEKLGITTDDLKDQNGQWTDITEKIKQHNQALKDNAELQAKQELYKDAIKERTKAEIELKEAEKARVDYYHENKEKIDNAFKEGYNIYNNAEYQEFQRMASAADELSKRLEETKKFEEETAEEIDKTTKKLSTSSSAAANYADDIDDINDSLGELDSTLEDVENKLTQENEKLLNNQQRIKKLREDLKDYQKQLKDADPTSDEYREIQKNIRATTEMIAYLQTKQVGIRQNIADFKNVIKDLSKSTDDAIGDTLSELQSLSSLIEKMKSEVEDGGSLTLSTLQNIMSKYPQLTDDVNDYIKGLKTESDLMKSLEKIYNDDVDAYNSAVGLKKIATEGWTADCSEAVKKLVNKYNEQYGIDIRNFADATAAKAAAHQKLMNEMTAAETEYRKIADENNYIVYQNAYGRSVYAKNADGSLRQVTGAELSAYDKTRQRYFDAQKAVNAFGDGSDFAKALSDDLVRLYGGTDADALKRLTGSNGSGGSSTSKNNTWSMTALGVYGSGNSAVAAELQWLDRVTALGKINEQQQKKYLDNWVTDTKLTADERYEIEKRLYDLNKKLSEKAQTEREQAAQDEQKKRLERLEYASAAYQKLVKGQISAYEANSDKIKSDLNSQIAALDDQLAKRKQQQEDDSRQDELNQLNLRLKYAQLSETERNLLEKQRESLIKQQQEVEFERNIENQKTELQKKANDQIARNTSAIERLNLAIEDAVYYFAKLSGSQTVSQIVNNSTSNQTTNYIRAGLTEAEANRLLRSIY